MTRILTFTIALLVSLTAFVPTANAKKGWGKPPKNLNKAWKDKDWDQQYKKGWPAYGYYAPPPYYNWPAPVYPPSFNYVPSVPPPSPEVLPPPPPGTPY
jgi:hypothetical protein